MKGGVRSQMAFTREEQKETDRIFHENSVNRDKKQKYGKLIKDHKWLFETPDKRYP